MYISKWWGNMVGGRDDALSFIDYFAFKGCANLSLGTVLQDSMREQYLG